ncbi:MAG: nitrilase-related carbon-nitrogen hydrolase [Luteolibacter sp.]
MSLTVRFLLAIVSGVLAVFAFPPFGYSWLVFLVWPLLFLSFKGAGFKMGFRLGVIHGMLLYGIGLSWFWNIFGTAAAGLWFLLALFTGLAGGLTGWVSRKWPLAWWLPLYAAAVWSGIGSYRCEWFWLRFPWMTPGLALGPTWISPIVGVYGAGFVVVLVATWLVFGRKKCRFFAPALLALLMSPFPFSAYQPGRELPVLAVQGESLGFANYRDLTVQSGSRDGVIVWPEYAVPYEIKPNDADWRRTVTLAADTRSTVVMGSVRELPEAKHYNVALTFDAEGERGFHAKNRPVPFMNDGVPGKQATPVKTQSGLLGTPICFDCDYTEIVRRMTADGAEAFTVPSMDVKAWSEREHLQHAELFRHRAAENARWFAVASSSGMTQFIDPQGRRVSHLPLMDEGVLRGSIWLRNDRTFFNRIGWLFPWLVLGAACVSTLVICLRPADPVNSSKP